MIQQCSDGYSGNLCAVCSSHNGTDYAQRLGRCLPCAATPTLVVSYAAVQLFNFAVLFALMALVVKAVNRARSYVLHALTRGAASMARQQQQTKELAVGGLCIHGACRPACACQPACMPACPVDRVFRMHLLADCPTTRRAAPEAAPGVISVYAPGTLRAPPQPCITAAGCPPGSVRPEHCLNLTLARPPAPRCCPAWCTSWWTACS